MKEGCDNLFRGFEPPASDAGGIRLVCEIDQRFIKKFSIPQEKTTSPLRPQTNKPKTRSLTSPDKTVSFGHHITLEFIHVSAGEFLLGRAKDSGLAVQGRHESPITPVTISRDFYIGRYEVTQEQYEHVMGANPSVVQGRHRPVEQVTFFDAVEFYRKLTKRQREAGQLPPDAAYRLPTEAEWEYVCKAGTDSIYSFGDAAKELAQYAWYDVLGGPRKVGQKRPNTWAWICMETSGSGATLHFGIIQARR